MTDVQGRVDAWYSGKAHRHRGNVQAVMLPDGLTLWTAQAEPGSVHDVTAARGHALPALYRAAALGMPVLADSGSEGAGIGILTPIRTPAGHPQAEVRPAGTRTPADSYTSARFPAPFRRRRFRLVPPFIEP